VVWRTMDVGRGKPGYRVWCDACGQDWTQPIATVAARVADGLGRPGPVSTYCECGSAIRVIPFGGTLQVDDPLRFAELGLAQELSSTRCTSSTAWTRPAWLRARG